MSNIRVNNKFSVEGKFSVGSMFDNSVKPPVIQINGVFQTKKYIEKIIELESDRYIISNIKVTQENFGSEEEDICYTFSAGNLKVKKQKEA